MITSVRSNLIDFTSETFFQHLAKKQKNAPSRSPSKSPASPRRFSILAVPTSKTKCSCSLYPLYPAGPGPPRPTAARARALEMNGREMRRPITRRKSWSRKKMRYQVNNLPSYVHHSFSDQERKKTSSGAEDGEVNSDDSDSDFGEFDDGLDEDFIGDEEDRKMLDEMNEKEREEEIFKRSEKREMEKKR